MTGRPLISVLFPCHNAATTLAEALASLRQQTVSDFEVVAVEDGSSDGTPQILAEWATSEPRLTVVATPHRGIVAALREAAGRARGFYLARMDADDVSLPHRFERQLDLMDSNPEIDICGTGVEYIPRAEVRDGALRYEDWINGVTTSDQIERDIFVECPLPHPTILLKSDVYRALGGYRDVDWPEDYDLVLRAWGAGMKLGKVPEVLLLWREHAGRLSRTDKRYDEDAFRRCKVHFLRSRLEERPVVVWGAGPVGKRFARELQRQGQQVVGFVDLDPRKIGQNIHGAPVIEPSEIGDFSGAYVVAAVGSAEARAEIRESWRSAGLKEPSDCCAVA